MSSLLSLTQKFKRILTYGIVGIMGMVVSMAVMFLLSHMLHIGSILSSLLASLASNIHNFLLNDKYTWGDRKQSPYKMSTKASLYFGIAIINMFVVASIVQVFIWIHQSALLGQFVGIVLVVGFSFLINDRITWGTKRNVPVKGVHTHGKTNPNSL